MRHSCSVCGKVQLKQRLTVRLQPIGNRRMLVAQPHITTTHAHAALEKDSLQLTQSHATQLNAELQSTLAYGLYDVSPADGARCGLWLCRKCRAGGSRSSL
jgi:hypothetical protein